MVCKFNTWLMSINPSDLNRFDWDDLRETINANVEDSEEADKLYEAIDWTKTDTTEAFGIVAKQVYDWMANDLNLFKGINRSIPGFKIEYDGWYNHGMAGLHIEVKVNYKSKLDVVKAIKRLPKAKFDEYMEKNHSDGSGFHSFIPNSRDGLLEQNDVCHMMACYLGYRITERTDAMTFENNFNENTIGFEDAIACPAIFDFASSTEAYEIIKFKEGAKN